MRIMLPHELNMFLMYYCFVVFIKSLWFFEMDFSIPSVGKHIFRKYIYNVCIIQFTYHYDKNFFYRLLPVLIAHIYTYLAVFHAY